MYLYDTENFTLFGAASGNKLAWFPESRRKGKKSGRFFTMKSLILAQDER